MLSLLPTLIAFTALPFLGLATPTTGLKVRKSSYSTDEDVISCSSKSKAFLP